MKPIAKIMLNYVSNKGEDKTQEFNIQFISQRMLREYEEIQNVVYNVQKSWITLNQLNYKFENAKEKNEIDKLSKEIEIESNNIPKLGSMDFFKLRFALIKRILMRNGYTDTKSKFLKFKFWDENVEPSEILSFLKQCIEKDFDTKKKNQNAANSMKTG